MPEQLKIVIDAEVNKAITNVQKFGKSIEGLATGSLAQLRKAALLVRTQLENLSPAALKTNFGKELTAALSTINAEIKTLESESVKAGAATKGAFAQAFNGAKQLANIIPGLGISTLLLLASDALIDLAKSFLKTSEAAAKNSDIIADAGKEYQSAVSNVNQLKTEIGLAKDGFLSKDAVVKHYNETIGKTTGFVKNLDEAEQALNKNADAYIKFTLLKAAANVAQGKAAEQVFNKALQEQKDFEKNFVDFGKKQAKGKVTLGATDVGAGDLTSLQRQQLDAQKKTKDIFDKRIKGFEDIANDFNTQAALIASSFKFDFFGDQTVPKDQTDKILARARAFVKEFGDAFVLPNLDETFFKGVKELLPEAKKLLQQVKTGDLQIKIPIQTDFELLPDPSPLTKEQLDDLTKRFFNDLQGTPVDIVIDPTLSFNNTKLIDQKLKIKEQFQKTFGDFGAKIFGKINFDNLAQGIEKATEKFADMKAVLETLTASVSEGLAGAFNSVFDAILEGKNVFKALGEGVKALVVDTIKAIVKMLILKAVVKALSSGTSAAGSLGGIIGGAVGGTANLGGAIGSRSFQNTLQVVVSGSLSGQTILLAGQRAAISNQRGG